MSKTKFSEASISDYSSLIPYADWVHDNPDHINEWFEEFAKPLKTLRLKILAENLISYSPETINEKDVLIFIRKLIAYCNNIKQIYGKYNILNTISNIFDLKWDNFYLKTLQKYLLDIDPALKLILSLINN